MTEARFLTLFLHFCFSNRQRSNRKKRRYGQIPVTKKMVTDEPSSSMVSSTTTSQTLSSGVLISDVEDELDTKENNQSDMNSLDNSPSSTTSSKKLNASPVAIPLQMTTVHTLRSSLEACDAVPTRLQIPSQEVCGTAPSILSVDIVQNHDSVAIVSIPPRVSDVCDSTTEMNSLVTSTTDMRGSDEKDSPILKKALKRRKKRRKRNGVTSSADAVSSTGSGLRMNGELVYNGAYQVMKVKCGDGGPCSTEEDHYDLSEAVKLDVDEIDGPRLTGVTNGSKKKLSIFKSEKLKTDESTSTKCEEDIDETVPSQSSKCSEGKGTEPKRQFPDSFEELILMHFEREVDVAEMVESMSCLERDNEATESELSQLMSRIDLLKNVNKQLDDVSFK